MWLSILIPILLVILVVVCLLLLLVVLMQRPRSEGLGAAFGSGMTENIFGAQTSSVLTKATVYLGAIFFGVTLLLTFLTAKQVWNDEQAFSKAKPRTQNHCRAQLRRRLLPPARPLRPRPAHPLQ